MFMASIAVSELFERLCGGDQRAVEGLMGHFFPRMRALAQRVLDGHPLPVLDAADVAQSAFATFWKRAEGGEFARQVDRNELWRLLATITVRRARRKMVQELADKRGGGRVLHETLLGGEDGNASFADLVRDTTVDDLDLSCQELLDRLGDDELRQIALWRLMGHSNRDSAAMKDCSERTIERKLELIREIWDQDHDA
ncbi:MAG: hypothetical protein RLY70_4379 [Planctomycetota bacterium]